MDALLLEKAEIQQSLALSRKDLERSKQQAKTLESNIEKSNSQHQEEVAFFQKLLKEREESDKERESERERERLAELTSAKESSEEVRHSFEAQLEVLRAELEAIQEQKSQEIVELQEGHQRKLTEAQQEVENLKEELAQKSLQHEEEMRALEEDYEIERERLLLLHEELTEQLALKGITALFALSLDVQEEDEDPARGSRIAKMLELSGCSQGDSSYGDGEETETGRLRAALEELRAQSTMVQDELTLLSNVKSELEAELERTREEFQMEREELEFKINELQMARESASNDAATFMDPDQEVQGELQHQSEAQKEAEDNLPGESKESANTPEDEKHLNIEELRAQCEALTGERDSVRAECQHMSDILQGEKLSLMTDIQDLKLKLEVSEGKDEKLLSSVEEQITLASELKQSVEELTRQNEEILSQLQEKEGTAHDLKDKVNALTEERDKILSQLQQREENMHKLNEERAKDVEKLWEERAKEALLHREEREQELENLIKDKEDEIQRLKGERENIVEHLKEEEDRRQETISALELSIKDISSENANLHQKLDEASSVLSKAQEERELLGSKLAALEAQLEQEMSEKDHLEVKCSSLTEEAEQAHATILALEEKQTEVLRNSNQDLEEFRVRVDELEKERSLLKSSLEEARGAVTLGEMQKELQARITVLEQERNILRSSLEEVVKDAEGLQKDLEDMKTINKRISEENKNLQDHVSMMTQQREEQEREEGEMENMEKERSELQEQLKEKELLISQMRSEMDALQVMLLPSAQLEKEHKYKDEKINKIKAVAIKAKKELDISKKENLQIDYDRQTEQLDKEREKVEAAERQIAELTKGLMFVISQNETISSEKEDLLAGLETLRNTGRQLEAQNQELQKQSASLDRELLAEKAIKEQKTKDLSSAMREIEELTAQLRKQQQQSQQTAQELEQLRKEAQQSSLLDMEMADYERLVKELNAKITVRDECAEELKAQINTLTQKEDTLKQEIGMYEKKKFYHSTIAQSYTSHTRLCLCVKIEVCELTAERHRLQEKLRSALEQQQRSSTSFQQRISSLQQERDTVKAELISTTVEFESYKVRVHNVLKQQKSKSTTQSEGDTGKLEREQLSSQVEQLRSRLAESHQSLQSSTAELQQLQTEHDTLLERHNKILQETISKEAELRERLLSVQSENVALRADLSQVQADLSSQVETRRQTYREQLRKLQDEHQATVETLQGQLTRVEEQLFNFLWDHFSNVLTKSSACIHSLKKNSLSGLVLSMAREEGEGMETTETESLSPALTPLPSLERLLTSTDPKQEPFVWTVEPTKEELNQKLSTATRSIEHMNSLLHETEATNAVLMEQITLLKSEVRRLERNQEREKSVANLEYLKNVLLQFIFLQSGSERQALLPVIHTMLQLSPEEKSKLAAIAQGEEEGSGSRGSGWTSYLHSWSGIR
uniref:GRIP domain-containing protein n=1 Tax=Mola mola TaxID=94237 RepID=A0A3Q3WF18_MOLML